MNIYAVRFSDDSRSGKSGSHDVYPRLFAQTHGVCAADGSRQTALFARDAAKWGLKRGEMEAETPPNGG